MKGVCEMNSSEIQRLIPPWTGSKQHYAISLGYWWHLKIHSALVTWNLLSLCVLDPISFLISRLAISWRQKEKKKKLHISSPVPQAMRHVCEFRNLRLKDLSYSQNLHWGKYVWFVWFHLSKRWLLCKCRLSFASCSTYECLRDMFERRAHAGMQLWMDAKDPLLYECARSLLRVRGRLAGRQLRVTSRQHKQRSYLSPSLPFTEHSFLQQHRTPWLRPIVFLEVALS